MIAERHTKLTQVSTTYQHQVDAKNTGEQECFMPAARKQRFPLKSTKKAMYKASFLLSTIKDGSKKVKKPYS